MYAKMFFFYVFFLVFKNKFENRKSEKKLQKNFNFIFWKIDMLYYSFYKTCLILQIFFQIKPILSFHITEISSSLVFTYMYAKTTDTSRQTSSTHTLWAVFMWICQNVDQFLRRYTSEVLLLHKKLRKSLLFKIVWIELRMEWNFWWFFN